MAGVSGQGVTTSVVGLGFLMQVMPYAGCWFYADGSAGSMYGRWLIYIYPFRINSGVRIYGIDAVVEVPSFSPFLRSVASLQTRSFCSLLYVK